MDLNLKDVRAEMPNYTAYKDWQRSGQILGIAIHHSATVNRATGAPLGTAQTFFDYDVKVRGWAHGSYNYVISGNGQIEYALDEQIAAYHAGFNDPNDSLGLEQGQYWNNHYLAICLAGWFSHQRSYRDSDGHTHPIPDNDTNPTEAQMQSLLGLIQQMRQKYNLSVQQVRGHRELAGSNTICPGYNFDLAHLRRQLEGVDVPTEQPKFNPATEIMPGEHVLILPDTDKYFNAAMIYVWKFKADVSFSLEEAMGRWKYVTVLGDDFSHSQLARLKRGGALLVQRVAGAPEQVQEILDKLANDNRRFLTIQPQTSTLTQDEVIYYTVQPGDTLSVIARQLYGDSALWRVIFEANRNALQAQHAPYPGQVLQIPPM